MEQYFSGIATSKQDLILKSPLLIYECEGTEPEIKNWFRTINIVGVPLNNQEINNAVFSGSFVTLAKEEFSNSQNSNIQKWSAYISGGANRQDFLERALDWVSQGEIVPYMSLHRYDKNINELKNYFTSVIDWVSTVFKDVESEMRGLKWGNLYETYRKQPYNPQKISKKVKQLYADSYVRDKKGIFEYILGGLTDTKLLNVRVFDDATKKSVYAKQTQEAEKKDISNCPLCAIGNNSNKTRIYKLKEMDADHVTAWSKGGETDIKNCEMLCKNHNRAKGNK
jgi:5-methylcytosine-specific restriction endonuclease McrA